MSDNLLVCDRITNLVSTTFADDQSTQAFAPITSHGRVKSLLWRAVVKSQINGRRNEHEDILLERSREVQPEAPR